MIRGKLENFYSYPSALVDRGKELQDFMQQKKYVPPFPMKSNDTFIGIEVEVERVLRTSNLFSLGDNFLWNNIEDGSLRNNGREFVSIPIKGDSIPYALNILNTTLHKEKGCVAHEFTDRTSVHVHMNGRDLTFEQFANLVLTYIVVEPLLYSFVGGDREKNIFCVPITQSSMLRTVALLFNGFETGDTSDVSSALSSWYKYTGFNLLPILSYGTIEYRHMLGTSDEELLSKWINLIFSIKNFAIKTTYESNKTRILEMNTSSEYSNYLYEVFGEQSREFAVLNIQEIMENTSIFVKDIFSILTNDTQSLYYANYKNGIKKSDSNLLFFDNAYSLGLLKPINVKVKIERILADIKKYQEAIDDNLKSIADINSRISKEKVSEPTKKKLLSNISYYKKNVLTYEAEIEKYKNQIKKLEAGEEDEVLISPYGNVVSGRNPAYFGLDQSLSDIIQRTTRHVIGAAPTAVPTRINGSLTDFSLDWNS